MCSLAAMLDPSKQTKQKDAPMKALDTNAKTELEMLIDRNGLDAVLDALSGICAEKAEHVLTNWQDKQAAKDWNQAASIMDRAAAKVSILL